MSDAKYRMERIERLLYELKYEITRGMLEGEINEHIGYHFVVPISKNIQNGIVVCEFRTKPVHRDSIIGQNFNDKPRLGLVE